MTGIKNGEEASAQPVKKRLVCSITGKERSRRELVGLETLRPSLADRIRLDYPELDSDSLISRAELARYRTKYVEELLTAEHGELTELDRQVAESIARHDTLAENTEKEFEDRRTLGERLSDHLASFGGSWTFIISFGIALTAWIGADYHDESEAAGSKRSA